MVDGGCLSASSFARRFALKTNQNKSLCVGLVAARNDGLRLRICLVVVASRARRRFVQICRDDSWDCRC